MSQEPPEQPSPSTRGPRKVLLGAALAGGVALLTAVAVLQSRTPPEPWEAERSRLNEQVEALQGRVQELTEERERDRRNVEYLVHEVNTLERRITPQRDPKTIPWLCDRVPCNEGDLSGPPGRVPSPEGERAPQPGGGHSGRQR